MKSIQDAIIETIAARRMSQAELSRRSGVSKSSLSRYLSGDDIPASKLGAIAVALDVTVDELMGIRRAPALAQSESELIALYRSMDPHGQEQLLVFARGCAASYPKNQASEMGA